MAFFIRQNLASDFAVDPQHDYCADNCDHKASEVEAVNAAMAEECADPATYYRTHDPQNNGNDETATIFTWHNPFRKDPCDQTKDNPRKNTHLLLLI